MEIVKSREVPGLARLFLARLRGDPRLLVEFVDTLEPGIPKELKWVMMISTQIGCPVGCGFCDAGALGYLGALSAEEILAQMRHIASLNPGLELARHPKVKVHFARMGEPSLNPHVLEALRFIGESLGAPGLIASLSTVAPKSPVTGEFFEELLRIKDACFPGGRFQLQFSLHSTDEGERSRLVPVRKWTLEEIAEYGRRFVGPGDRRITLNFASPRGSALDAGALSRVFSPEKFLVKLTPVNPTLTADQNSRTHLWSEPPERIAGFARELGERGFRVILSPSLPEEISAETSCGQLWSESLKEQARILRRNLEKEARCYLSFKNLEAKARSWTRAILPHARPGFPLRPAQAALIVVDMQEFFLSPRSPAYLPQARVILSNVRRLADSFRRMGRPVLFIRHAHEDPSRDGGLMSLWWRKVCMDGSPEARISPILEPREGEVLRKCRYSAFSNPSLEEALRRKGVSELVVCGIVTNLCVESTVRAAFDLGFKASVIADATAAHAEELHLASLMSLAQGFSAIRLTEEVCSAAARGAASGGGIKR